MGWGRRELSTTTWWRPPPHFHDHLVALSHDHLVAQTCKRSCKKDPVVGRQSAWISAMGVIFIAQRAALRARFASMHRDGANGWCLHPVCDVTTSLQNRREASTGSCSGIQRTGQTGSLAEDRSLQPLAWTRGYVRSMAEGQLLQRDHLAIGQHDRG
jgi:hypothetical protein